MTDSPKTYVLYADTEDGFTGAWVIWRSLGDSAVYRCIPASIPEGARVYLIDVPVSDDLASRATTLDYFATSPDKSAARKVWESFHRTGPSDFLRYIEDAHLGRSTLPFAEEIGAWRQSYGRTFARWTELATSLGQHREIALLEGTAILRFLARTPEVALPMKPDQAEQ